MFKLDFAIIKEVKKNLPKGCGFGKSKPLPTAKGKRNWNSRRCHEEMKTWWKERQTTAERKRQTKVERDRQTVAERGTNRGKEKQNHDNERGWNRGGVKSRIGGEGDVERRAERETS